MLRDEAVADQRLPAGGDVVDDEAMAAMLAGPGQPGVARCQPVAVTLGNIFPFSPDRGDERRNRRIPPRTARCIRHPHAARDRRTHRPARRVRRVRARSSARSRSTDGDSEPELAPLPDIGKVVA
jgi:hypothetical protein